MAYQLPYQAGLVAQPGPSVVVHPQTQVLAQPLQAQYVQPAVCAPAPVVQQVPQVVQPVQQLVQPAFQQVVQPAVQQVVQPVQQYAVPQVGYSQYPAIAQARFYEE